MRRLYVVSLHHGTRMFSIFFFNDTATTEIYTLSLHDALPISSGAEYCIIFEQLLDSDLAFQTLCFCDPSDGYEGDRKSTRLNSSHSQISYAVFCLKKKKTGGKPRSRQFICATANTARP